MSFGSYGLFSNNTGLTVNPGDPVLFSSVQTSSDGLVNISGNAGISVNTAGYYFISAIFSCYSYGTSSIGTSDSTNNNITNDNGGYSTGGTSFSFYLTSSAFTGVIPNSGSYGSIDLTPDTSTGYSSNMYNQVYISQSFITYLPSNSILQAFNAGQNVTIFPVVEFMLYNSAYPSNGGKYLNNQTYSSTSNQNGINCSIFILELNELSYLYGMNLASLSNYGSQTISEQNTIQLNNTNSMYGVNNNLNVNNQYIGSEQCSNQFFENTGINTDFVPYPQTTTAEQNSNYILYNNINLGTGLAYMAFYNVTTQIYGVSPLQSSGSNSGRFASDINNAEQSKITYTSPINAIGFDIGGTYIDSSFFGGGAIGDYKTTENGIVNVVNNTSNFNIFGNFIFSSISNTNITLLNAQANNSGVVAQNSSESSELSISSCMNNYQVCNNINITLFQIPPSLYYYSGYDNAQTGSSETSINTLSFDAGNFYPIATFGNSSVNNGSYSFLFYSSGNTPNDFSSISYNGENEATFIIYFTITVGNIGGNGVNAQGLSNNNYPAVCLQSLTIEGKQNDAGTETSPNTITYNNIIPSTFFTYVGYSPNNILIIQGQYIYTFQPYKYDSSTNYYTWDSIGLINPGQNNVGNNDVSLYSSPIQSSSTGEIPGQCIDVAFTALQIG